MQNEIRKELAFRELSRRKYSTYLSYVHGPSWIPTRMSQYIASRVQEFLEADTGHAYDILVIHTPPQHGKSMTVTETLPFLPLPSHCPWVNDFLDQFTAFPNAPHDDMVDACSQALNRMIYARGELLEEKETAPEKPPTLMETLYNPYKRQ